MLGLKIVKHLYIGHFSVKLLGLFKITKLSPHPSFAHPSPSIGGELVTTAALHGSPLLVGKNSGRSCGSPPLVRKDSGRSCDSTPLVGKTSHRSFDSTPLVGKTSHRSFDSPPLVGAGSWQGGRGERILQPNNLFPCWEQNIPTLGTIIISHRRSKEFRPRIYRIPRMINSGFKDNLETSKLIILVFLFC